MDKTNGTDNALELTRQISGPWLAIRAADRAEAMSIVIVNKLPGLKATCRPVARERFGGLEPATDLIALADFGVRCSVNPGASTLTVRLHIDRTPTDPRNGCPRIWLKHDAEVINVDRAILGDIKQAVEALEAEVLGGAAA